ncbi:MAG TPA: DUF86 domain-containing protein [Acidobacteriota bacterium]
MSPGQLDPELIRRHLYALDAAVCNLERHRGKPLEALAGDPDEAWAVERGLMLCAQNVLDIATHLAASAGRDATDYAAAIDQLAQLGVLPPEFAAHFRAVAGFRNILVHGYLKIDYGRVHELLNGRLSDFRKFAVHVERHLQGA